jgi:hypothetical protein
MCRARMLHISVWRISTVYDRHCSIEARDPAGKKNTRVDKREGEQKESIEYIKEKKQRRENNRLDANRDDGVIYNRGKPQGPVMPIN